MLSVDSNRKGNEKANKVEKLAASMTPPPSPNRKRENFDTWHK